MQTRRLCYFRQCYRSHGIQFVNDERQREVAGKHRLGCQNNLGVFESRLSSTSCTLIFPLSLSFFICKIKIALLSSQACCVKIDTLCIKKYYHVGSITDCNCSHFSLPYSRQKTESVQVPTFSSFKGIRKKK